MFEVLDKDDNVVRTIMAREGKGQAGFVSSETGAPIELKPGEHVRQITPSSGGGRAAGQVLRQQIGAREVQSDLENAVQMPIGQTTGMLGQFHPGVTLKEALAGDLARKLTSQDAQLMQTSMANMSRELSILMSPVYGGNWAAEQMDPLIPKEGDTVAVTIFDLARFAQTADNALEGLGHSHLLSGRRKSNLRSTCVRRLRRLFTGLRPTLLVCASGRAHKENFGEFVQRKGISSLPERMSPSGGGGSASGVPVPKSINRTRTATLPRV